MIKIKELLNKVLAKEGKVEETKEERKKPPRRWWDFPFRMVNTSRGGIDMPRRQPCPECHSWVRRTEKLAGGANYLCSKHGEFFVRVALKRLT